jgi:hypothetical protein
VAPALSVQHFASAPRSSALESELKAEQAQPVARFPPAREELQREAAGQSRGAPHSQPAMLGPLRAELQEP